MKKLVIFSLILAFFMPIVSFAGYVNGYVNSHGTYVNGYYRSAPDGNPYNNYSYPGNTNPYTGKVAPGNPSTYLKNYYNQPTYSVPSHTVPSVSPYYPTNTSLEAQAAYNSAYYSTMGELYGRLLNNTTTKKKTKEITTIALNWAEDNKDCRDGTLSKSDADMCNLYQRRKSDYKWEEINTNYEEYLECAGKYYPANTCEGMRFACYPDGKVYCRVAKAKVK